MPTEIVGVYESLGLKELLALLSEGLMVTYETASNVVIFSGKIPPGHVISAFTNCSGGRFVVRKRTTTNGRRA
tara:strand:- start:378 stop:596 length:219 start_codon:yes stop_codon:yes gene_type:complete